MGNNTSDAFGELYSVSNFKVKRKTHLEPQLIILPHQRIIHHDDDENQAKIGLEWKTVSCILSSMTFDEKSLHYTFQQLASHSGAALIKTLNEPRHSPLKSLFYSKILPFIVQLLLKGLLAVFPPNHKLYTLPPKSDSSIQLTRGQIAVLLACYFFGLFTDSHNKNINFNYLLSQGGWTDSIAKYHCWLHYFDEVRKRVLIHNDSSAETYDFTNNHFFNKQYITIYRRYISLDSLKPFLDTKHLASNRSILVPIKIHRGDDKGIEDCPDSMHMNFANGFIGGKVLTCGSVQEEILFTINTECLVSMLFCRKQMLGNESIIILGSEQFFNYTGYGYSFKYNGVKRVDEDAKEAKDEAVERLNTCIIGMDALCQCGYKQIYNKPMIREMIKSFVGFSCDDKVLRHKYSNGLATGNWGCGIFGGDPQLKCMLQWIAASLAGINMVNYYVRSNKRMKDVEIIIDLLTQRKKNTVSELWKILSDDTLCSKYQNGGITLFAFIKTLCGATDTANQIQIPADTSTKTNTSVLK